MYHGASMSGAFAVLLCACALTVQVTSGVPAPPLRSNHEGKYIEEIDISVKISENFHLWHMKLVGIYVAKD
ncbi:hypothetical protein EVAR_91640_1 [Eumeta japonica]|uniref:Uncharacterized protein n=1 Tax=Eumeta variegata TaxID=151549 RepID=A0A4C2A2D2_EUMVA|nr:hypothetical protein EVAR_91640_1 [Eumeta japonica]